MFFTRSELDKHLASEKISDDEVLFNLIKQCY